MKVLGLKDFMRLFTDLIEHLLCTSRVVGAVDTIVLKTHTVPGLVAFTVLRR